LGFRSLSRRLEGASFQAARGLYTLRTEILRALRLGRDAPSPGRLRPLLTLSFHSPELPVLSHGEVSLGLASFRSPSSEPLRARRRRAEVSLRASRVDRPATWPCADRPSPFRVRSVAVLSWPLQRLWRCAVQSLARLPALGSTLVRCPSPSGSFSVRRVALYWLPALPPHRFDGRGVFLVVPCRRTKALRSSLVGFGASPECSGFASARSLVHRSAPFEEGD